MQDGKKNKNKPSDPKEVNFRKIRINMSNFKEMLQSLLVNSTIGNYFFF